MEFIQAVLRALQFLWTLLITALVGNVIDDAFRGTSASVNYGMFVAVFSWLVILFGVAAAFVEAVNIPIALLVADGLAALFTFIAGVVFAAGLGAHNCNNFGYTSTNSMINSGGDLKERCQELQASTAFFWFLWACYTASLAFNFMNRGGAGGLRGGSRNGPVMTQV